MGIVLSTLSKLFPETFVMRDLETTRKNSSQI